MVGASQISLIRYFSVNVSKLAKFDAFWLLFGGTIWRSPIFLWEAENYPLEFKFVLQNELQLFMELCSLQIWREASNQMNKNVG